MKKLEDMDQVQGKSFEDAIADIRSMLDESARQAMAYILSTYPDREVLNSIATMVRRALQTNHVQVNAIYERHQITVGGSPHIEEPISIPECNSLCTFTAGLGTPMAVNNLKQNPVTHDMVEGSEWKAWASAPIRINGQVAGSVCALESRSSRIWTSEDERRLLAAADQVSDAVTEWLSAA